MRVSVVVYVHAGMFAACFTVCVCAASPDLAEALEGGFRHTDAPRKFRGEISIFCKSRS